MLRRHSCGVTPSCFRKTSFMCVWLEKPHLNATSTREILACCSNCWAVLSRISST
jgi:hypothetical protein